MRSAQATLGAMVLVCKDDATSFAGISPGAFAELGTVTADIEAASKAFRAWDKINYLMLMMVDPDVHFHVLPRYAEQQELDGVAFADPGWPGPPDLGSAVTLSAEQIKALTNGLKAVWPQQKET
ncbi:MAG: HIT family protein [Aestuariivirgaceae bacterium]